MNKLAIVIPYYKVDFLEECLKSVAAQTAKNFTLYIGNDGSPDDPTAVVEKYFNQDDINYFQYEQNVGKKYLTPQWERILKNVSEDWFQILGDDDMIGENFVEEFYQALPQVEKDNISCIKFKHEWVDENNQLLETFDYSKFGWTATEFFMEKYSDNIKSSLSENIFKTAMFRKYGFERIPLAWGSDDLALVAFSGNKKIFYNQNATVKVRISGYSISGSTQISGEKSFAYNVFREKFLLNYARYFPDKFVEIVLNDYLSYSHVNRRNANFLVSKNYFLRRKFSDFLKCVKKIYYINSIAQKSKL